MSFNQLSHPESSESDIFTMSYHHLTIDEWIYLELPCVLLYRDGLMEIYPIQEYTGYELTMLQSDWSYKSSWLPIRCGSFLEMQKCMYEVLYKGLCAVSAKLPELSGYDCADVSAGSRSL